MAPLSFVAFVRLDGVFEVMLRELGGVIWIQIASAIVLLRLILWVPFHLWRLRKDR